VKLRFVCPSRSALCSDGLHSHLYIISASAVYGREGGVHIFINSTGGWDAGTLPSTRSEVPTSVTDVTHRSHRRRAQAEQHDPHRPHQRERESQGREGGPQERAPEQSSTSPHLGALVARPGARWSCSAGPGATFSLPVLRSLAAGHISRDAARRPAVHFAYATRAYLGRSRALYTPPTLQSERPAPGNRRADHLREALAAPI